MNNSNQLKIAVETIKEVLSSAKIPVVNIYLFGSRARGNFSPDSDWDFLICCKFEIPFIHKADLAGTIQTLLAEKHISADIIFKTEEKIKKEKNNVGVITYYALKDGITV